MGVCVSVHDNEYGIDAQTLESIWELDGEYKRRHVTGIGLKSIHELMKSKIWAPNTVLPLNQIK